MKWKDLSPILERFEADIKDYILNSEDYNKLSKQEDEVHFKDVNKTYNLDTWSDIQGIRDFVKSDLYDEYFGDGVYLSLTHNAWLYVERSADILQNNLEHLEIDSLIIEDTLDKHKRLIKQNLDAYFKWALTAEPKICWS